MWSVVLFVFLVVSAVVLALGSSLASGDELLYRFGLALHIEDPSGAYSQTMAAHYLLPLVLAVGLVTILFALGGRRKPWPRIGGER